MVEQTLYAGRFTRWRNWASYICKSTYAKRLTDYGSLVYGLLGYTVPMVSCEPQIIFLTCYLCIKKIKENLMHNALLASKAKHTVKQLILNLLEASISQ